MADGDDLGPGDPGRSRLVEPGRPDATVPRVPTAPAGCEACGSPQARAWATPEGPARLCPPCATLHGIGCP